MENNRMPIFGEERRQKMEEIETILGTAIDMLNRGFTPEQIKVITGYDIGYDLEQQDTGDKQ